MTFYQFNILFQTISQHAIAVLPAAHMVYGFNETFQYLSTRMTMPYVVTSMQQYPQHRNLISAHYLGALLFIIGLGQNGLQYILTFLPLIPLPTKPPSCNTTQAFLDLGLNPGAPSIDIVHAWKKTSTLHPDKSTDDTAFITASHAYNCLREKGLVRRGMKLGKSKVMD